MYTTLLHSIDMPAWDEVQTITENSGRPLSDFTDVAKVLVAAYRNEDWPDRSVPPSPDVILWGMRAAIGVLRGEPEVFERMVHTTKNNP